MKTSHTSNRYHLGPINKNKKNIFCYNLIETVFKPLLMEFKYFFFPYLTRDFTALDKRCTGTHLFLFFVQFGKFICFGKYLA